MTKQAKRELAAHLYTKNDGTTLAQIAAKVGVHPNTITKWKKEDDWEGMASYLLTTRYEQLRRYYAMMKSQNDAIMAREEGHRHPTKVEADAGAYILKAIDILEKDMKVGTVIDVFTKFLEFSAKVDGELTKRFAEVLDKYIKSYHT